MKTIETKVYTFDELSDKAKEKARSWWREYDDFSFSAEYIIADAKEIGALMGIEIDKVYYSGFWSQGDGACFTGNYQYKKGAVKAVKDHTPLDTDLHNIATELQELQKKNFYRLSARIKHSGHYYHSDCTEIDVENINCGKPEVFYNEEETLKQLLRDYMDWIYRKLEKEYDYQNSDSVIDETMIANEYTFTIDGKRFG